MKNTKLQSCMWLVESSLNHKTCDYIAITYKFLSHYSIMVFRYFMDYSLNFMINTGRKSARWIFSGVSKIS